MARADIEDQVNGVMADMFERFPPEPGEAWFAEEGQPEFSRRIGAILEGSPDPGPEEDDTAGA